MRLSELRKLIREEIIHTLKEAEDGSISLGDFINKHRNELRKSIRQSVPNVGNLDDDDLEEWILNDEGLYNWAKEEGVDLSGE